MEKIEPKKKRFDGDTSHSANNPVKSANRIVMNLNYV